MDKLYYGHSGSGKSYEITQQIRKHLLQGKRVILLIPEQDSVNTEQRITTQLSDIQTVNLEIMNFNRLANYVFREYGGLDRQNISVGGKRIYMSMALENAAPALRFFRKLDVMDRGILDQFIAMVDEFRMYRIPPHQLEQISQVLMGTDDEAKHLLAEKTSDFALIYSAYLFLSAESFTDGAGDLERLYETLRTHDFFHDTVVVFDGYFGFTPIQFSIISEIIRQSEQVIFSFPCLMHESGQAWLFHRGLETEKRIRKQLKEHHRTYETIELTENHRCADAYLPSISDALWNLESDTLVTPTNDASDQISLVMHDTIHSEAEWLCRDILKRVRGGLRYRDITIVTRSIERYEGILEGAFAKYEIPFYFSVREPLAEKSLFRFIYALLRCYIYHCRQNDMITLIKCGYLPFSQMDVCSFENYVTVWNISGSRFFEDEDWRMNPDGFVAMLRPHAAGTLQRVNDIKRSLAELLQPLFDFFDENKQTLCAETISKQLITLMLRLKIPEKLTQKAGLYERFGNLRQQDAILQIWQLLIKQCDELVTILGKTVLSPEQYLKLLDLLVTDTDIGTVPPTADSVTFGDAALLRPRLCRHMYLIGATDGSFPKSVSENTFFSDLEKRILSTYALQLSPDTAGFVADESFYFYYAFSAASESVSISAYCSDYRGETFLPSIGYERIAKMTGKTNAYSVIKPEPIELLEGAVPTAELYGRFTKTALGDAILRFYREWDRPALYTLLQRETAHPITESNQMVSTETMESILGHEMHLSPSRLEKYVNCHFSYFCDSLLKLQETQKAEIRPVDTGKFIHYVLEHFVKAYQEAQDTTVFNDAYVDELLNHYINDYLFSISGGDRVLLSSKRLIALFNRMKRTAKLLIHNLITEFQNSDFRPVAFEYPIGGMKDSDIAGMRLMLEDGTTVTLGGQVDRLDTWEHEGKTYIRIIDYKTGTKKFRLEDVSQGLNMQMLIYLFTIWNNGTAHFNNEVVPGGVLYLSAKTPSVSCEFGTDEATIQMELDKTFRRDGLILHDEECLRAMDHFMSGRFIPIKLKKNGKVAKNTAHYLASLEEFGKLSRQVEAAATALANGIKRGDAQAKPLCRYEGAQAKEPCTWCQLRPVCRRTK